MLPKPALDNADKDFEQLLPVTPDGSLRKMTHANNNVYWQPVHSEEAVPGTPRKRTAVANARDQSSYNDRKQASSPTRCSPSKRMSPSSSSSPSRRSGRKARMLLETSDTDRPPRQRSRTNSVTAGLVEGLAGTTMECVGDDPNTNVGEMADPSHFAAATIRSVRFGINKCTPLLKALSEPWKTGNAANSDPSGRGHRRSAASETVPFVVDTNELFPLLETCSDASVTERSGGQTTDQVVCATASLGPPIQVIEGSNRQIQGVRGCRASTLKTKKQHASTTRETNGSDAYRSLTKLFYPTRRSNLLSYSSLAPARRPSSPTRQDSDGLGIDCYNDGRIVLAHKEIQVLSHSSAVLRKWSLDSTISSVNSIASIESATSSTPSIVVTPPATPALTVKLTLSESPSPVQQLTKLSTVPNDEENDVKATGGKAVAEENTAMRDHQVSRAPLQNHWGEESRNIRERDDALHLELFKVTVDKLLSEFLNCRSAKRVCRVTIQTVDLLSGLFLSTRCSARELPALMEQGRPDLLLHIKSLSDERHLGQGKSLQRVSLAWRVERYKLLLQAVMDHVVTGLIALVNDERAPFGMPQALTGLCSALEEELPSYNSPKGSTATVQEKPTVPQLPLSSEVEACVTSTESLAGQAAGLTSPTSETSENSEDDEEIWSRFLSHMTPSNAFTSHLRDTIQLIFQRGEAIRSRANLLDVPPARKGSRKRWLMATADLNRRRSAREAAISQVKRGIISEGRFRHLERQWAAAGDPKDSFAGLCLVRFIGELYNVRILDVHIIRRWLLRFFRDTVFPGVPSSYELEAGCALLITVGRSLELEGGVDDKTDPSVVVEARKKCESTAQSLHAGDVTARDVRAWGDVPHFPTLAPGWKDASNVGVAQRTMSDVMSSLRHITALEEVGSECRGWAQEVIALRSRGWHQKYADGKNSPYKSIRT